MILNVAERKVNFGAYSPSCMSSVLQTAASTRSPSCSFWAFSFPSLSTEYDPYKWKENAITASLHKIGIFVSSYWSTTKSGNPLIVAARHMRYLYDRHLRSAYLKWFPPSSIAMESTWLKTPLKLKGDLHCNVITENHSWILSSRNRVLVQRYCRVQCPCTQGCPFFAHFLF